MDTLQQLASTKFVLNFLKDTKITLSKSRNVKISFDPPKTSVILHATEPLWMFAAMDDSIEQICFELNQWASYNLLHLVFSDDNEPTLFLRDFAWNNSLIDYEKTALNLAENKETFLLDDCLILSVIYGFFTTGERLCKYNETSKFKYENEIAMYRRLALGYITPSDVLPTAKARIRFPMNFLMKIPVENLLRMNFVDVARRLLVEYSLCPSSAARQHLRNFFADSGRIVPEILPALITALIPTLLNDERRCETLFRFAVDVCGEEPVKNAVEKWPGSTTYRDIDGLYTAVVRHPMLAEKLINLLISTDFSNVNWSTLVTLTRQNDYVFRELLNAASKERVWKLLSDNDYELFLHVCENNARKSILWIKDNVSKEGFEMLIKSRQYGCFLAACKKGHFLVVKILSDTLDEGLWDDLFSWQNYEAFFLATKGGFIAVVEWFGMLCTKYNMTRKYQEAHMITMKMLEIEAKMLQVALDMLRSQRETAT